ncbi:cilia- and flagella-associated protein 44-like isoform X2 [Acanthaster planci]|uniref:Cilia- and flagella-associated protein 44 n=1 Tax=Acanthaster planci TaxID=133434 RepID=A0A8B7YEE9_ACAPL|nr:cilia- and flagella-associated protein 44-like isoform X2 [Acanthaster planci]
MDEDQQSKDEAYLSGSHKNPKSLRAATHKLQAEALRQYREAHAGSVPHLEEGQGDFQNEQQEEHVAADVIPEGQTDEQPAGAAEDADVAKSGTPSGEQSAKDPAVGGDSDGANEDTPPGEGTAAREDNTDPSVGEPREDTAAEDNTTRDPTEDVDTEEQKEGQEAADEAGEQKDVEKPSVEPQDAEPAVETPTPDQPVENAEESGGLASQQEEAPAGGLDAVPEPAAAEAEEANTNVNANPSDKDDQGGAEQDEGENEGSSAQVEGEGSPEGEAAEGEATVQETEAAEVQETEDSAPLEQAQEQEAAVPQEVAGEQPTQAEGAKVSDDGAENAAEGAEVRAEEEEGAKVSGERQEAESDAATAGEEAQVAEEGAGVIELGEAVTGEGAEVTEQEAEVTGEGTEVTEQGAEVTGEGTEVTEQGAEVTGEGAEAGEDQAEEEGPKIPLDFFYDYQEHVSRARMAEDSDLPADMLTLYHSFGYDCKRLSNLYMLDANTLIFAAGNLVELLNIQTKEQKYIRSTGGGGIGAITVHPSSKYFAVCEKGTMPNINIYEYPSLKLYRILREGTETAYAFADFNPAGTLLASVGCAPDYMLTVWDWGNETIVLRSKAFSQDIFRVTFSPENEGLLTSSGTGHIRFWKMAHTFTGLKLQGQLGKFGRTEISDIHGYVELPDGKVLSGAEWGNMLLWEGGLIKVQISRKNKKPCHNGNIEQFVMDEGELISIGADGFVRVWDFETIDTADSANESGIFEMDCMNELKVGNDVHLISMVKSLDPEVQSIWYAQDANGAIWKLDLSFSHTTRDPEKLFSFHAGEITSIDTSPVSQLVASAALDHTVRVYDYASKTPLCSTKFNAGSTSMLWVPPIVDPKGSTLLAGFADGVVRSLTLKRRDNQEGKRTAHHQPAALALKQAFKPHTKAVTAMAMDSKGEILTTAGADNTLFFMNVGDTFTPIGFIDTPGQVTHITWSPGYFDKNCALVFCANGEVLEVEAPEPGTYDTSTTFKITGLKTRQTTFKSIKSRLRREEEEERKRKEEEARQKELERKRRIRRERGLEDEDEEEDKKEEEEEEEPPPLYIPEEPSPILYGVYSPGDPDKFWVSMGTFDAGYLYECKFRDEKEKADMIRQGREEAINEAIRTVPVNDSDDVPIRTMQFTGDGKQVLLGMENGAIQIHPLDSEGVQQDHAPDSRQADFSLFGPYWSLTVHDNSYGRVTGIRTSFDGRFVFTCGADGNLFAFELMSQEKIEEARALAKAKIPSAKKEDEERKVSDIESKEHYSIELEKQKSEQDKRMRKAEEKKMEVRRTIAKLRRQFKKLLEQNQELPEHLQLQRKEFEMDPGIRKELEKQTNDKIELVQRELAWEAEKHRISLEKLKERFKTELECERIVVVSIQTDHELATYRTTKLPREFHEMKQELTRRATVLSDKGLQREPTRGTPTSGPVLGESMTEASLAAAGARDVKKSTVLTGRHGEKVAKALQKAEKVRQKRLAREKQWEELLCSKPPEDYEDPADVAAIKDAQDHMGDFKLKTAKDYSVPEHLRMNALKKRNQLVTLEEMIHKHKSEFNKRVVALRDKKIHIIQEIQEHLLELNGIQKVLEENQRQPLPECPTLHPCETPEKKLEYTRETLMQFKAQMAEKAILEKTGGDTGGFGFGAGFNTGGGGSGGGGGTTEQKDKDPTTPLSYRHSSLLSAKSRADSAAQPLSPLEQQLLAMEAIRLHHRQGELIGQVQELVVSFDAELRMLRHEKLSLDTELKHADLRRVTLFEELQLLKEFEKRENVLAAKVETKIKEKSDSQVKVAECQQKLDAKRKDIDRLNEREKALYANFQASLGENNKFAEFLTKVFKKKIKRAKKKAQTEEGSDEESEESSEDESDWSSDEEDSEEEGLDDSVCPPGCDQALFDNTCALREKRLDIEELLAEEKKIAEGLKKEVDALTKKQKVIDSGLKTAEADLEAFQLEKQQKLNELDVVVTLRLHQVEYMVNGAVPQDLSQVLVFNNASMARLQHRIQELKEEKTAQRRHYKEHRQQHVQLIKDRKLMESRITELEEKCNEMMRQKFGRIIDLEKLETVGVNRTVEELKEKLRLNELANANELQKWDSKIEAKKARITELIEENTLRLQQLTMLVGENKNLEKALDARQTNLGGEFQGSRKADLEERGRLIQLVQLQAQEIEALKEEISLLSRKGGHILPPTQPPIQQSSAHGQHPPGNAGQ